MPERSPPFESGTYREGPRALYAFLFRFIPPPRLSRPAPNKLLTCWLALQVDAATGLPASNSATSFTMGCTSAIARTGTSFIKMDTAAPVSSPP